jgi:mannose-6-phosphate isomerase-like protein (cupin superfamily)
VLSLLDLTEKSLSGRDPLKTVAVGCSGLSRSQLLVVRDAARPAPRPDVDEALYLIAGEATLTLGGRDQAITPGWFTLVPRGTSYSIVKKGRNPAVLLSVVAGVPCSSPQSIK